MEPTHESPHETGPEIAPYATPRATRPLLKIVVGLLIVVVIAGLSAWLLMRHHSPKPAAVNTTPAAQTPASVTTITADTAHYDSSNFALGFDYPKDWKVADDDGITLTVTSPVVSVKADTQTTNLKVIFMIQHKQTQLSQFAKNTAIAVIDSQKVTYKAPTPSQRAQTYVSFVNYAGGKDTIDGLYVTGNIGYQALQSVPEADVIKGDPLVSLTFQKCSDTQCSGTASAGSITQAAWSDQGLSKPLLQLVESLKID